MKKLVLFLFIAVNSVIIFPQSSGFNSDTLKLLTPESKHRDIETLLSTVLMRYHYKRTIFNDSLSSFMMDTYLKTLDNTKSYFLESDIKSFEKYRYTFDDDLRTGNLTPAFEIFNVLRKRIFERLDYGNKALDKEFDFTVKENFEIDRDDAKWPTTTDEANDFWRQRIKYDALNLKLTGKEWKDIVPVLKKRYDNLFRNVAQYTSEDAFQFILNAYTESVDPHTNYMSPVTSDDFKINMSLSLEGIGAQLQQEDEYTKVNEIIVGGPAYKSDLLHKGDKIIAVAQGDTGVFVDVVGWRITEVVQLIRGPKESVVRLQIIAASDGANALPKEIKLVRDKIKLEEQAAKKEVIEIDRDDKKYKIGVISIPTFYMDFEAQQKGDKDYKSTSCDVRKLLAELQEEKVDGVLIDLRNNGGGSLPEAIQLSGLFIQDGPVVQVRNADGSVDLGDDPDPEIVYSGPMGVLVNKFSASASEIFSAAIQDYGRGLIIGDRTFGKGTVQNLIDINRLLRKPDEKLGEFKMTIAKFYRVTGGSTQHKGVMPDVVLPSYYDDPNEFGESAEKSALPYDKIRSARYIPFDNLSGFIGELNKLHNERVKEDFEFKYLQEDIETYKANRQKKYISLNEEDRKKEKEDQEEKEFQRENERRKSKGLELIKKGEKPTQKKEADDIIKNESAKILGDLIFLSAK